ncbi:PmoA family protein [Joostella atrarenae]|uniref:PmoA family protein n=1 Tax=Joostella atrarenae TaxID=679257 RepID=A0ABS9J2S9_9FLAO|nr:DUF6807 family protein [Joostella atrarenae]MCF8714743.1 PmoA family protein [Joostella atrarenae]
MMLLSERITYISFLFCFYGMSQSLTFETSPAGVLISEGEKKVLFFQKETKALDGKYPRANYIHPLYDMDGAILTEDFPEDHLHHRGIFWAWHQLLVNNVSIGDGWECKNISWDVKNITTTANNDGSLQLNTTVFWNSSIYKEKSGRASFVKEETAITIHPSEENYRVIDFEISLLALADNLKIGGSDDIKGYSGFSARLKLPEDILFSSSEKNITPINEAIKAERNVVISGSFNNNKKSGLIIIASKENPSPNNEWILRSKNSMQNAAYPGQKPIYVSTEDPIVLKYRIIIYKNDISTINPTTIYQY